MRYVLTSPSVHSTTMEINSVAEETAYIRLGAGSIPASPIFKYGYLGEEVFFSTAEGHGSELP